MGVLWLFSGTIFLSAFLIFLVQPMFGKLVLPLLGGTPAVWNTCLFFFQTILLAGYAYAHFSIRGLGPRKQTLLHCGVVLLPLLFLPLALPTGWSPPTEQTPVFWLLLLLLAAVGVPFFVVSTTSPLIQRWFAATEHPSANDPYFLYGASNLGSMLALVGYPLLIEPNLRLSDQGKVWGAGYALLALLVVLCAFVVRRYPASAETRLLETTETDDAVPWKRKGYWILLSFLPSSWMLGVTQYITTDLTPIPLLWVIPMALYLLTFILVFARRTLIPHAWMVRLFPPAMFLLAASMLLTGTWLSMVLHLLAFFIGSMVCHGELARSRPHVTHLTEYYFCMSIGGMLGGLFNAMLAPLVFRWLLEYPLTLFLACAVRKSLRPDERRARGFKLELLFVGVVAAWFLLFRDELSLQAGEMFVTVAMITLPLLILVYTMNAPRLFTLGIGVMLLVKTFDHSYARQVLHSERSFFGFYRVVEDVDGSHWLEHGTTVHGAQKTQSANPCLPLTYYYPSGPLGQVFSVFQGPKAKQDVALIGLGAGAAGSYMEAGQKFTFYEVDPAVKRIAEDPEFFTYLSGCARGGDYEIILGDGRLKLAEADANHYGMIVFDAFSSDAIPVHLLTREAFGLYLEKLADDGILVFHISNRHLDLEPVIADVAYDAGLVCLTCRDSVSLAEEKIGKSSSTYMVVAREKAHFHELLTLPTWTESTPTESGIPWTDDYSNLIGIMSW